MRRLLFPHHANMYLGYGPQRRRLFRAGSAPPHIFNNPDPGEPGGGGAASWMADGQQANRFLISSKAR